MSTREPIEFASGDVIVHAFGEENESTWVRTPMGEWRSAKGYPIWADEHAQMWLATNAGRLVHQAPRPSAVDLPSTPTLGWATFERPDAEPMTVLGTWQTYEHSSSIDVYEGFVQSERDIPRERVTAFSPATAVPTEALAALRDWLGGWSGSARYDTPAKLRVARFLEAVDGAPS